MADAALTKKAIAQGFKELMAVKRFDKITISDITSKCNLNRQTFYYHFSDKYDLLTWIYQKDVICYLTEDVINEKNWSEQIYLALRAMQRDDYFYINAFKSSGRDEFIFYFAQFITQTFEDLIHSIDSANIDEGDCEFISRFYAYGIVGIIFNWVTNGMKESPEVLKTRFENLVLGTRNASVQMWVEEHKKH